MGFETLIEKKRLLIVCGTGGVGKTTLAAALALKGAHAGKKTLVITVDPAKRLAEILGITPPCPDPKRIWKGEGSLWACLLEAKQTFDDLIRRHAAENIRTSILHNPLYRQLSLMLAGTQEYMAMEKLYALAAEEEFDLIVVDTPPARQAIDFLLAPMRLVNMINDSLLRWLIAPSLKLGNFGAKILSTLSDLSGKEILEDIGRLMRLSLSLLEGFTQRSDAVQAMITGKECAFLAVDHVHFALQRKNEAFREALARMGFDLEGICINRAPPSFGKPAEIEKAVHWAAKQKDPLWQRAGKFLEENEKERIALQKNLKTLLDAIPYSCLIPEMTGGITHLADLEKIVRYL